MRSSNGQGPRLAAHAGLSTLLTLALAVAIGAASAQDNADKAKDAAPPPQPKVKLGLHLNDPKALPGYTVLSTMNSKSVYLLDNEARVVHEWKVDTTSMH